MWHQLKSVDFLPLLLAIACILCDLGKIIFLICASISPKQNQERNRQALQISMHSRFKHIHCTGCTCLIKAVRPRVPQGDTHALTSCLAPAPLTSADFSWDRLQACGGVGEPHSAALCPCPLPTPQADPGLASISHSIPINP